MCGFTGYISPLKPVDRGLLAKMLSKISFRGPDSNGLWIDPTQSIGFAHARLAIIDLSPAGRQPFLSPSRRYSLVFNGEIYNHHILRHSVNQTTNYPWAGTSDTESLLAALTTLGVSRTLSIAKGMFAFAFYDTHTRNLVLARDFFGEKPLYYGLSNNTFFFGSQLSSFIPHPNFQSTLSLESLADYLSFGYVPDPASIYQDFFKVEPGHFATINAQTLTVSIQSYSLGLTQTVIDPPTSIECAALTFNSIFGRIIKERTRADVPVGAFLSGGVDSSLVAATMQSQFTTPINTYTIGFDSNDFNEAPIARSIANALGTNHHELIVSPEDALNVLPLIPSVCDEPLSDSSLIPTLLLCRLVSQDLKVVLSGDGADELFFGYKRYKLVILINRLRRLAPFFTLFSSCLPTHLSIMGSLHTSDAASLSRRLAHLLRSASSPSFYSSVLSTFDDPSKYLRASPSPSTSRGKFYLSYSSSLPRSMMNIDTNTYLPGDNLVKVDRSSMYHGLEVRAPFLDPELYYWSLNLPENLLNSSQTKPVLRTALSKFLPSDIYNLPKRGFAVPLRSWLKGPLASWVQDLLSDDSISSEGIFDVRSVRTLLYEFYELDQPHHWKLWNLVTFQQWYFANLK